ncbi:MAG: hypothetical protein ACREIG_07130 [Nitrospiraceae bacterium]
MPDWINAIATAVAVLLSAAALWRSFRTESKQERIQAEQLRLDREQQALESKVLQAQLDARDADNLAVRRELQSRISNLFDPLTEITDGARPPTADGVRGMVLWADADVDRVVQLAARLGSKEANGHAQDAARALTYFAGLVRPHVIKDVRRPARPFEPRSLTGAANAATQSLRRLHARSDFETTCWMPTRRRLMISSTISATSAHVSGSYLGKVVT